MKKNNYYLIENKLPKTLNLIKNKKRKVKMTNQNQIENQLLMKRRIKL
jgi:hypothetical protein